MQTSAGQPLDLNDRGQGRYHAEQSPPDVHAARMARFDAAGDRYAARMAEKRQRAAWKRFGGCIPCPEPVTDGGDFGGLFRDAASQGFRGIVDEWHGFTAAGRVMEAGVAYGRSFQYNAPAPCDN